MQSVKYQVWVRTWVSAEYMVYQQLGASGWDISNAVWCRVCGGVHRQKFLGHAIRRSIQRATEGD